MAFGFDGTVRDLASRLATVEAILGSGGPGSATSATVIATGSTTARNLGNRFADVVNVKDFGAVGDGVADDTAAIQAAITAAVAGPKRLVFEGGKTYNLGNRSAGETVFLLSSVSDLIIDGRGAELILNTTDNTTPNVFRFNGPNRITVRNLRFRDTGFDWSITWKGAVGVMVNGSGTTDCGGVLLENVHGTNVVALLMSGDFGDTGRLRGISLVNCSATESYYGINCQENGDDLRAVAFRASNVRRPYFVYGVKKHDVDLVVNHNGTGYSAESAILVKRYMRDTRDIRVKAMFSGDLSQYAYLATLEHQPTAAAPGTISGVQINASLASMTAAPTGSLYHFRSYTGPGVLEATTSNVWRDIVLDGTASAPSGPQLIAVSSIPSTEAKVSLGPGLLRTFYRTAYPNGGFAWRTAPDREMRTVVGDLTARTIDIPTTDALAFTLKLKIWAHDNAASLLAQNMAYEEHVVTGYNASAGNVTVQNNQTVVTHTQGVPPTITIAASGENVRVSFAGAGFTGASAMARVDVEYVSTLPW